MVSDLFFEIYMIACFAIIHCYYIDLKLCERGGKRVRNPPDELRKFLKQKKRDKVVKEVEGSFDEDNLED